MSSSFKVLNLFGFDVRVHWSWIFIFLLITWTFSVGILEEMFPDWATTTRWATGAAVALVFFSSILFHELSHSVVARYYGIPISSITLFVFGGVSNLGREADTPRQEFFVAVVGPLTSLALAAGFGLVALALLTVSDGAAAVAANLATINLAIAIFNLVPGFPLDGGRVLRSWLWARSGDRLAATESASRVGTTVAYVIMGLGAVSFFLVSVVSGIWLFLIGNFLRMAAESSYLSTLTQAFLSGVPATRLARSEVPPVSPDATLSDFVDDYLLTGRGSLFPVARDGRFLGLISLEDLRRVDRDAWAHTRISEAMKPRDELVAVLPDQELDAVLEVMLSRDQGYVPVVDNGTFYGVLRRADLLEFAQARHQLSSAVGPRSASGGSPPA